MDEDGNGTIDQKEMFNFMKKKEFVAPNAPQQTLTKTKTKKDSELSASTIKKQANSAPDKKQDISAMAA